MNKPIAPDHFRQQLLDRFGPLVPCRELPALLGFPSAGAVRQARHRGRLGVSTFKLPNRRGCFAYTEEIADWLSRQGKEVGMS